MNTLKKQKGQYKKQRGESLVEVMVAVLVLSVGLLGLAGLQAAGIRQNSSSYMRTQAVFLADQILDRVRANPGTAYSSVTAAFPSTVTDCQTNQCTPSQMSSYDIASWKCAFGTDYQSNQTTCTILGITQVLPNGQGSLGLVIGTTDIYQVSITWQDNTMTSTTTAPVFTVTSKI